MEDKKYSKLQAAFEATQPQMPADFTERVMKRIEEQESVMQPKRRRVWLYPAVGVAAAIVLLLSVSVILNNQDGEKPNYVAKTDSLKVKEQPIKKKESKDVVDTVKKVKEILQMSQPPKHYMAKRTTKVAPISEPVTDVNDFAERALAEEERRIAMEMMEQMNGNIQADYQEMTREIRQRGERMNRKVEMAINDDAY